jgi:dipeptidyl aminopeptidase/acylaminoacyl peptidase
MPAELIEIELANGRVSVISSPNDVFLKNAQPRVRFYPIEMRGQDVYGRLYLPLHYREATRYPIVFTQYYSGPGFVAATGDEVPIIPMAADDIAVFALQSSQLDLGLANGDFRLEISRLSRPLEAMEWVVRKLDAEGLVDRERVAVTGLSYGAESAMYGYWRSRLFRAVSVASASWDPILMPFGGLTYEKFLEQRGFPFSYDQSSIRRWRDLSAGLNARATLPPLLLQSSDAEENITVPTWFQLRRAGAPVEWYEYPNEGHVKESPAHKWWIYQRNLDWFRFWLKDEEDPSPTKAEQYQRWRKMRADWEAAKKANSSSVLHDGTRPPEASGTRPSTER